MDLSLLCRCGKRFVAYPPLFRGIFVEFSDVFQQPRGNCPRFLRSFPHTSILFSTTGENRFCSYSVWVFPCLSTKSLIFSTTFSTSCGKLKSTAGEIFVISPAFCHRVSFTGDISMTKNPLFCRFLFVVVEESLLFLRFSRIFLDYLSKNFSFAFD